MTDDDRIEAAIENEDLDELRRLAAEGQEGAADALVVIAGERGDVAELRRLAEAGSAYAGEVLADLTAD